MQDPGGTLYYCFNVTCPNSITKVHRSGAVGIDEELALSNNFNCPCASDRNKQSYLNPS